MFDLSIIKQQSLIANSSFINGEFLPVQAPFIEVDNPATGQTLIEVADADAKTAERAVKAAEQGFKLWRNYSAQQRADYLMRWYQLTLEHLDDLAKLLTLEQGKVLNEAKAEISYGASFISWFAEEAKRIYGDTIAAPSQDKRIVVIKQPLGVVGAITPWNFPHAMIARKAAAALATGCSFVVRSDVRTPLTALAMAKLSQLAGIPAGVFNVVIGSNAQAIGEVLTQHPSIAKFTFTGSTPVGKKLLAQCAQGVKKASMELGGNAPFIVFDDADIEQAVAGAMASKYRNAGQTCVCTNRIFVQRSIAEQFTEKFIAQVAKLKLGNGLDADSDIGSMISLDAVKSALTKVQQAIEQGGQLAFGKITEAENAYLSPIVLTNISNQMAIAKQELFAPISTIIVFDDEQQVIEMANDTEYGLAAYFYSRDVGRVWRVAEQLEYGMIGINEGIISNATAPFGGVKQSGFGREGSKYGLDDYLSIKYLCMGGI